MLPLACLSRSRTICCYCAVVGLCVFRVWVDVCLCLMCVGIWSCDREEGADERSASFWSFEVRNRERDKGREGEREGETEGGVEGGDRERLPLRGKEREREGSCLPMCRVSFKCQPVSVGVHGMCVYLRVCVCIYVVTCLERESLFIQESR